MLTTHNRCNLNEDCATVVYLRNAAVVTPHFYLAQKKKNIHTEDGKELSKSTTWNGYGGRWQHGDNTILKTAQRELYEESGGVRVLIKDLMFGARIEFFWPGNVSRKRDMEVFFFTAYKYSKEPEATKEMGPPELFNVYEAPYKEMMPADEIIIPILMSGKIAQGKVYFQEDEKNGRSITSKDIRVFSGRQM